MGGRGPAPKVARSRARDTVELVAVVADGLVHGPELPCNFDWPDVTREWWGVWRRAAGAGDWTETDWSFLLDTAVLHAAFWDGDMKVGGELRLRVAKFGATPEDRMRLKLSVGDPKGKRGAPRSVEGGRRGRLLAAVADDSPA